MLCHKTIIIGFGIFAPVFFSVLLGSSCFASSVSCDMSSYLNFSNNTNVSFSCDTSSLDSSVNWYYYGSVTYSSDPGANPSFQLGTSSNNGNAPLTSYVYTYMIRSYVFTSFPSTVSYLVTDYSTSYHYNNFKFSNSAGYVSSFILNIADSVSFESSSPTGTLSITENGTYDVTNYATAQVDVPPEIVQGDYHDDLSNIYRAIIICAGVILVLYFFYCIYRIFIKGPGGY